MNSNQTLRQAYELLEETNGLITKTNDLYLALQDLVKEYQSLERSYLQGQEQLQAAQRQVILYELAAKGQGLDENDIPYDLAKPEAQETEGTHMLIAKDYLRRMYEGLEARHKLPKHLYGSTLGDEYRALTGHKGY